MSSGFDPSEMERELGIDDDSIRQRYGNGVNLDSSHREAVHHPPASNPVVDPVIIPPDMRIPGKSAAPAPKRERVSLWNLFGVTLNVKKDMSSRFRYTKAITYALPFAIAALMMNIILVPMTAIIWYLVLVAFGKHIPTFAYTILLAIAMAFGVLGLVLLRIMPWVLDAIFS